MRCSFIIKSVLDFERNSKAWKVDSEASLESLGTKDLVLLQVNFWYSIQPMNMWNYSINQISYPSYYFQVFHNIVMLSLQANWDSTNTNESQLFIEQQFWRTIIQTDQGYAQNLKLMGFLSFVQASLLTNLDPSSDLIKF